MGTFDGVHRGHQTILAHTVRRARARDVPSLAVTFHRPPRLFFFPPREAALLTLLPEKMELLRAQGIDRVAALRFDKTLAGVSARDFFETYFLRRWRAREIVVGFNFGFGRGRQGDARLLESLGRTHGVPVTILPPVDRDGVPVSSESIRAHLRAGDLAAANLKLGYPYFMSGKVRKGAGRGRGLGFPTANLAVSPEKIAPLGVFAVRVRLPGGKSAGGMVNIGFHPTVGVAPERTVEVHLFDFEGNLLGQTLRLELLSRLRSERRFPSVQNLVHQLDRDAAQARRALARGANENVN
jgi:riboflavin kinase/FMN adenylyltransferase